MVEKEETKRNVKTIVLLLPQGSEVDWFWEIT